MKEMFQGLVMVLAVFGVMGIAGTGAASESNQLKGSDEKISVYYVDDSGRDYAGYVQFKHKGDMFKLYRAEAPGGRIYVRVKGNGESTAIYGPEKAGEVDRVKTNLKEGAVYKMKGCLEIDALPDHCSKYRSFTA